MKESKWLKSIEPDPELLNQIEIVVQEDYSRRRKERRGRPYEFDPDKAPLPPNHEMGKVYCGHCTDDHFEDECPRKKRNGDHHDDLSWFTTCESGTHLKGK